MSKKIVIPDRMVDEIARVVRLNRGMGFTPREFVREAIRRNIIEYEYRWRALLREAAASLIYSSEPDINESSVSIAPISFKVKAFSIGSSVDSN